VSANIPYRRVRVQKKTRQKEKYEPQLSQIFLEVFNTNSDQNSKVRFSNNQKKSGKKTPK